MAYMVIIDVGDFFNMAEQREEEWMLSRLLEQLDSYILLLYIIAYLTEIS